MRIVITLLMLLSFASLLNAQTTYTFNGNGNWSDSSNWLNRQPAPDILTSDLSVIIAPIDSGSCIIDVPVYVPYGTNFTVLSGKKLVVLNNLEIDNVQDTFGLTIDDINFLDSISIPSPARIISLNKSSHLLSRILTDNVNDLVGIMIDTVKSLSAKKQDGLHPEFHDSLGPHQPAHFGLAYRFGGKKDNKSIINRLKPDYGDNTHNADSVFGTDCTGLMLNLVRIAGIKIPYTISQRFDTTIQDALKSKDNIEYNNIRFDSIGKVQSSELKNGDFIIWKAKGHIGMFYRDDVTHQEYLFNSNGNPNPERSFSRGCNNALCEQIKNRLNYRGVHSINFAQAISSNYPWTSNFEVFRLHPVNITTDSVLPYICIDSVVVSGNIDYTGVNRMIARGICWSKTNKPTIKDNKRFYDGPVQNGHFDLGVSRLDVNSVYYIRSFVTIRNSVTDPGTTYYGNEITHETIKNHLDTFIDERDQQPYPYKKIGSQVWMTKNINYDPNSNSVCYNNQSSNCATYGRLYEWNMASGACPTGWHLPSSEEWGFLIDFVSGTQGISGGHIKTLTTWQLPNTAADNLSGFSAIPAGGRQSLQNGGVFDGLTYSTAWWTSSEYIPDITNKAIIVGTGYDISHIFSGGDFKNLFRSVRCIKN